MGVRSYIVSAADSAPGSVAALAGLLQQAGFEVTQQLEIVGVIVGRADDSLLPRLRSLPGVGVIEEEGTLQRYTRDGDDG